MPRCRSTWRTRCGPNRLVVEGAQFQYDIFKQTTDKAKRRVSVGIH